MNISPFLKTLPTYQPGRPIEEVARELNLPVDTIIKVASNENPFGPSPLALAAMREALADVNLQVEAGQMVALVGPSGAGKTTLSNLVARFYDPTAGRVTLEVSRLEDPLPCVSGSGHCELMIPCGLIRRYLEVS